jgi:UDP-glucose 4-epimerase
MQSTILVTGGAGYIGSHAARQLIAAGHRVAVIDNLSRGHRAAVPPQARFEQLDLAQTEPLIQLLKDEAVTGVMHFAALAYVGESVEQPLKYYQNNLAGTLSLLRAMDEAGVKRLVFSSTTATYGIPAKLPIVETTPQLPINPYGWSKRFVEQVLIDHAVARPDFWVHRPALLQRGRMCRRRQHRRGPRWFYNVGIGRGYSVREVIESAVRVTGRKIPLEFAARRAGDPPELWASADRLRSELGWSPRFTRLDDIIATAWKWFREHPQGYGDNLHGSGLDWCLQHWTAADIVRELAVDYGRWRCDHELSASPGRPRLCLGG